MEALCRLFPEADLFTLFYNPERISPAIRSHKITVSGLNWLRPVYKTLLPLMPVALEQFDLRGYDLVISSESGPAKGVLTASTTRHICYCHTPMRYLWDLYPAYMQEWTGAWRRRLIAPAASYLRLWDYASAARVDEFVANSENVRRRIWKTYRRPSEVVHPPVPVETFLWKPAEDYFLTVSELVAYKRIADAVRFSARTGRRLKVVGEGPEYRGLKRLAGAKVEFCGRVSDQELRALYARCRAFLMPGEDDFGMTAVEALASGKPVIALGRGGVLETVSPADPPTGVLYADPGDGNLAEAVNRFEQIEARIDPRLLQESAGRFSESRFAAKMTAIIQRGTPRTVSGPGDTFPGEDCTPDR